jgi:hypothetical protein
MAKKPARRKSAFFRSCLASALPVVDDAVVVDTGSSDRTPEIARELGARVIRAAWPGDLGRAHDLPLAHARGDWILSLDGDEVLDPATRHLLRDLVRDRGRAAYRLPIRNYSFFPEIKMRPADAGDPLTAGALCFYPTSVIRLHRHRPEIRHQGRLHQSLEPAIVAQGGTIADAPVPIHHYGPLRLDKDKHALYRILARRQVEDAPDNARAWFDFGMMFAGLRVPGALDAFRRAHALGLTGPSAFMIGRVLAIQRSSPARSGPSTKK